jgi:hypothetical protein
MYEDALKYANKALELDQPHQKAIEWGPIQLKCIKRKAIALAFLRNFDGAESLLNEHEEIPEETRL